MVFHTQHKHRAIKPPVTKINNTNIEKVEQFKFLGLTLDSNLNWKKHSESDYARRSSTCNVLFNYCIHSRGEYIKDIGAILLLIYGGKILRGGLSMTEVYTKCTALFIVRRRTPARCK